MLNNDSIARLKRTLRVLKKQIPDFAANNSKLKELEVEYTFDALYHILYDLNKEQSLEEALSQFLARRWLWVQNTDLQYCHAMQNPANELCTAIAKELANISTQPYPTFLMPSLLAHSTRQYISSHYADADCDLRLNILSDDNTHLLHIPDILEYAKEDSKLKRTIITSAENEELSKQEAKRLLNRSNTAKSYLAQIVTINKIKQGDKHSSIGSEINKLVRGLYNGRAEGEARTPSYVATACFFTFWNNLPAHTRETMLRDDEVLNRGMNILMREGNYCTEILSEIFADYLDKHPELYDDGCTIPVDQGKMTDLINQLNNVATVLEADLRVQSTYIYFGKEGDIKAIKALARIIGTHNEPKPLSDAPFAIKEYANKVCADACRQILTCFNSDATILKKAYASLLEKNLPSDSEHAGLHHGTYTSTALNPHSFHAIAYRTRKRTSELLNVEDNLVAKKVNALS